TGTFDAFPVFRSMKSWAPLHGGLRFPCANYEPVGRGRFRHAKRGHRRVHCRPARGTAADLALIFAQTDPPKGHDGIAALLVEKGTPGPGLSRTSESCGRRTRGTALRELRDARDDSAGNGRPGLQGRHVRTI